MKGIPEEDECDRILIVEGYSDLLFAAAFLRHLGRLDGVFIKQFAGKSNILKRATLRTEFSAHRLAVKKAMGILVDADDDPDGTTRSLADGLLDATGLNLTEAAWSSGESKVGFFVAPDGTGPGEIETLVWNVWSEKQEHAPAKESVLTHLAKMEAGGWKSKSPDKGRIAAFLAAAYDEDPRLGAGAREGLFDFDDPGFDRLRKFLLEFSAPISTQS